MVRVSTLGEALRRERQRRGELQRDAAERFGVSQPSYHRWEAGDSAPADESRHAIAEYLGITVQEVWELLHHHTAADHPTPTGMVEQLQRDVEGLRREIVDLKAKFDEIAQIVNRDG